MSKCKYCNKEFNGKILGNHTIWCDKNPKREQTRKKIAKASKGRTHTEKTKRKISKSRTEYLKENPDEVPYKLNHSSKMSWPERAFLNALIENDIEGWVYDYNFSIYSLDFAFPEYKLDVEIDGRTHLQESVIKKDKRRDIFLRESDWRVIRFTSKEIRENVYLCLRKILPFINCKKKVEIPKEFLKKSLLRISKEEKRKIRRKLNKKRKEEKIKRRKEIILNSSIDFSSEGWVNETAELLNLSHSKITPWLRDNMKQFWLKNCKIRKGTKVI